MNHLFKMVGQETIYERLQRIIEKDRIATAYLFSSTAESVGDPVAMNFVGMLHCRDRSGCGDCLNCKKIKTLQHPDVHLIFALPSKSGSGEIDPLKGFSTKEIKQIQNLIFQKSKNPYMPMVFPSGNTIRINSIREMKRLLFLGSHEGGRKTTILFQAEKLSEPAANSLLKILEEPPPETTIILLSSNADMLLPTIRSRCQEVQVPIISVKHMYKYLSKDFPQKIGLQSIVNLSEGDLNGAIVLAESPDDEIATVIQNYLSWMDKVSAEKIVDAGEKRGKWVKENFGKFSGEIRIMQCFFRDTLILMANPDSNLVKLVDHKKWMLLFNAKYPNANINKILETLENYVEFSGKNLYITPLFIHLILSMREMTALDIGDKNEV